MKMRILTLIIFLIFIFTSCSVKQDNSASNSNNSNRSETNNIIASKELDNYVLQVIQTEYKDPQTPEDENFDIFKSGYLGRFAVVAIDNKGNEVSRKDLNSYFGNVDIGFIGKFDLIIQDYNKDGCDDFSIGQYTFNGSHEFAFVPFSISKDRVLSNLPTTGYKDDGYIYCEAANHTAEFSESTLGNGIEVDIYNEQYGGYKKAEYNWDGKKFIFKLCK